jgi:hypothetical protein
MEGRMMIEYKWNHPLCDPGPDLVSEGEMCEFIVAVGVYGSIEVFTAHFINNFCGMHGWYSIEGDEEEGWAPLVVPDDDEVVFLGWTTFPEWDHPEWFDTSPQGRE